MQQVSQMQRTIAPFFRWILPLLIILPEPSATAQAAATDAVQETDADANDTVITDDGQSRMTEYRRRGQTYKIEIDPVTGNPYYLYDADAASRFDESGDDYSQEKKTTQWRLFQW